MGDLKHRITGRKGSFCVCDGCADGEVFVGLMVGGVHGAVIIRTLAVMGGRRRGLSGGRLLAFRAQMRDPRLGGAESRSGVVSSSGSCRRTWSVRVEMDAIR